MSKLSKRAISILVIATFMMSIFAVIPVKAAVIAIDAGFPGDGDPYEFGETVIVTGTGVTSGALVNLYWDYVTLAGQMNSTLGDPSGSFEVWLDVPEAAVGDHYVWVKDVGNNNVDSRRITVTPLVELSPSSGLKGDDLDVDGHGFGEETVVGIQIDPWTRTAEAVGTGTGTQTVFNLDYFPVVAASETIYLGGAPQVDDGSVYTLVDATGVITFVAAPAGAVVITADYDRAAVIIEASTSFETDEFGWFTKAYDIPDFPYGTYDITATDDDAPVNTYTATLTIGASITVSPDEGPTGTVVTVEGRGWTNTETITFREETSLMAIEVVDGDVITVGSGGTFSADVVIPELGTEDDYDIEAVGTLTPADSSDGFELNGLPEIVVSPTYGTPGSIITVKGYNFTQIAGTEVELLLINPGSEDLVIAETDSNGNFEDTFMSPAVVFQTYDVEATDEYSLVATDPFKVGLIALIINPVYGEAGAKLSITGIGFAPGSYNVTFGIKLYEDYGTVSGGEAISDIFYVPNIEPGTYDMIITDTEDNEMTVEFRVTAVTEVTLDPATAPNTYNMTIEGYNFADKEFEEVEFVLYNATEEWDMDVWQGSPAGTPVETSDDGNFTAWWLVLDEDTLDLGDYTINVTGYDDFFIQVPFSVVEARVDVAPRKALFDRGDTIQFNVNNDFDFKESYMKIWDPYDNLYWQTEKFADWVKSGDLYTVPYYLQTSGMNPMELTQDAPLGTWFYVFYETGTTQLVNGTFEVGPSAESLLTDQIAALSEELGIDIDTLRTYIDAKIIDLDDTVSSMAEDIATAVSGMEDDISGLSDDLDDAVTGMQDDIDDMGTKMDSIETMVDDISGTSTAAQDAANDAKNAADQSLEAAEKTQQQTSGLTGLVYGAIGASLIAALAAIVSLMQISRRIAG